MSRVWAGFKKYVRATPGKLRKVGAWFKKYKNFRKFIFWIIVAFLSLLLFGMLWAMVSVMLCPDMKSTLTDLTGVKPKHELLKFIGLGMGGIIATLGVVGLLQRATALNEQNEISEKGHLHDRFKAATEHLGNKESASVRIAAFNEFYHIADIEPDWRKTIFDILCAHLRQTTKDKNYQKKEENSDTAESDEIKPTEEVQSLLNILFEPRNRDHSIFSNMVTNLKGVNLQGANLKEASMDEANLQNADLQNADLQWIEIWWSDLQGANLQGTNLKHVFMEGVCLQNANLLGADMQGTYLQRAKINKNTKMPDNWKDIVEKDENGKTGVLLVDDKDEIIERL